MGVTINQKSTTTEPRPPKNGQQPKPLGGLNAFYWYKIVFVHKQRELCSFMRSFICMYVISSICLEVSSADNIFKQFGPRSVPTKRRVWIQTVSSDGITLD